MFSNEESLRYARHFQLQDFGAEAQLKLKSARVLCVGAGGLGSPVLLYLAAAGVGRIGIIDDDIVDMSNLQRQVLFATADCGKRKAIIAKEKLLALNSLIQVDAYDSRLTEQNVLKVFEEYDVIIDCSDNYATRFLINDACVYLKKPNVAASISQFEGHCSVFGMNHGPCYRCLYQSAPPDGLIPNCAEAGVLGVLPGLLGTIQANEVIKLLTGIGHPLIGKLLTVDTLDMRFTVLSVQKNQDCIYCGIKQPQFPLSHCGTIAEPSCNLVETISPAELKKLLLDESCYVLDVRSIEEHKLMRLPNSHLLPLSDLSLRAHEIPRDKKIIVYCLSGQRSKTAVQQLSRAGLANISSLAGGLNAWIKMFGLPNQE